MKLTEAFPYMVCVNLAHRSDRRRRAWEQFRRLGLEVDRQPGVSKEIVTDARGFHASSRYACSLAKRLAIRRARLAGAPAVLMFEDDVVFAGDLHERLAKIELPADWGIFMLGCRHVGRPVVHGPGLVRVTRGMDHHAMAVREDYYLQVMRAIGGYGKGVAPSIRFSDLKMTAIQERIPTYAPYPNLAWQATNFSDNSRAHQTHYDDLGHQLTDRWAVASTENEMRQLVGTATGRPAAVPKCIPRSPRQDPTPTVSKAPVNPPMKNLSPDADEPPGLDCFADVPAMHKLEATFPLRFYLNLARREDRRMDVEYQFAMHGLQVERLPAADGRRVRRASRYGNSSKEACDLSHRMAIRQAARRGAPAVLIFEDDVVLHQDFRRLGEALKPPNDWGVILFGCTHVETPAVVAPGWVRARSFWSLHAYAVRAPHYQTVLSALHAPPPIRGAVGTDVTLSALSWRIPMYAVYPNLAWQNGGFSDLRGSPRNHFRRDGRQNQALHAMRDINETMKSLMIATSRTRISKTP